MAATYRLLLVAFSICSSRALLAPDDHQLNILRASFGVVFVGCGSGLSPSAVVWAESGWLELAGSVGVVDAPERMRRGLSLAAIEMENQDRSSRLINLQQQLERRL